VGLSVVRCAPSSHASEWSVTIRGILLADVLTHLLQFEPYRGLGVAGAQKGSPEKFLSFPESRVMAIAFFPFQNPITEATGCFGGMAMSWAPDPASSAPPLSRIPSA